MEDKFEKDLKLKEAYVNFMVEYESLGHMMIASTSPIKKEIEESFFLPYHGVWKETSSTTKLRTVFNGSSKTNSGTSLNDLLLVGPNLLPMLCDIIIRWRHYRFVFAADIEKMYRQILVHESDLHFQSILWRKYPSNSIGIYRLKIVTDGLACSSFLASRTLRQLAVDHSSEYPLGSQVLQKETYMDDILSGAHSVAEVIQRASGTLNFLSKGGFPLRKWSSNNAQTLQWLLPDLLANDPISFNDSSNLTGILGISWHPTTDCFRLKAILDPISGKITKRALLSKISQIFDPLGWLAPVINTAKILLQSLWLRKIGWDDELPLDVISRWTDWHTQLPLLKDLAIPRWTSYDPASSQVEIHGFADASKDAYGAVIYLRFLCNDQVSVSLQISKTSVAHIKTLSIPWLELCAAHLLARLVNHLTGILPFQVSSTHLWTDSADVLHWLQSHPSRWPVFVANRCSEGHTLAPLAFWHHVRSSDNPADLALRGIELSKLLGKHLWWEGPEWLSLVDSPWLLKQPEVELIRSASVLVNISSSSSKSNSQANKNDVANGVNEPWLLVYKFSSLNKLLRVTAYCLKFIISLLHRIIAKQASYSKRFSLLKMEFADFNAKPPDIHLSVSEIERARLLWINLTQREAFPLELKCLSQGKPIKNCNLLKLSPFLDKGLLRVGGRLAHAKLDHENQHPLILPSRGPFVELIIRQTHISSLHGGTQLTLSTLRQRYWVIRGRQAVKSIIHRCMPCIRYSSSLHSQLMGNLPAARVNHGFPFQRSGVDYAGPVSVRLSKSRGNTTQKGYIAILVCFATRAVHLEIVEDYSSSAFIAAFHRFTARRGHSAVPYSDQGTNFVGSDKQLQLNFKAATRCRIVSESLSAEGTSWLFNPPAAPHFGGLWEAAVKAAKRHLRHVISDQVLTFVEYSTLLCRIEACLNSRPLCPISDDVSDLQPLTPAHFLIQRCSFLVPEPDLQDIKLTPNRRWDMVSQLAQQFWTRWRTEYLTSLQSRPKWLRPTPSVQEGALVIHRNELSPPGKWPLARIVTTHLGSDGKVRVVNLKTATSTFQRPINKVIPIPLQEQDTL